MREKILAFLLSVIMMFSAVSPAFAAEFSGGDDEEVFVQEGDAVFQGEASFDDQAAESQEDEIFSDAAEEEELLSPKEETGEVSDSDIEALLGESGERELICTTEPITRPDAFTPIGNGCDVPSVEEVIAQAGPELFTSGSEKNSLNQADVQAITKVVEKIRNDMVQRKSALEFTLKLSFEVEDWNSLLWNLILLAMEETGNPCEGDYLRWNFQSAGQGYIFRDGTNGYYNYKPISFYTTYAQEQKVTSAVNKAIAGMKFTGTTTPFRKIRTIYDYICTTVTYDYSHLNNPGYTLQYTAYAAIINKTAVCQGYSLLLYRMLREVEIDNRMVPSIYHIWNIVYLKGIYYNVDATWDSENYYRGYEYFLKGSRSFEQDADHIRENNQLYGDYNSAEFRERYPTSVSDYVVRESDMDPCSHTWGAWEVLVKGTCSYKGIRGRVCKSCGEEQYEQTEMGSHTWKYTCNKNNTHTLKCSVCGASKTAKCTFTNHICKRCKGQQVLSRANIITVSSAGYNKLKITWGEVSGADGYAVQYLKGSEWQTIQKVSGTSFTHTSSSAYPIKTGTTYYYRIRAYYKLNGKYICGAYSAQAGGKAALSKPSVTSFSWKGTGLKISWKKVSGATGYQIQRWEDGQWSVWKTAGSGTLSVTDKTLKKGKVYQYRIRAYRTYGNKRVYSGYSAVKKYTYI